MLTFAKSLLLNFCCQKSFPIIKSFHNQTILYSNFLPEVDVHPCLASFPHGHMCAFLIDPLPLSCRHLLWMAPKVLNLNMIEELCRCLHYPRRFPTFLPTAFLTTTPPSLTQTLTLTIALTMTVLTFWSEMQWSEIRWAEKGVTTQEAVLEVAITYSK